MALLTWTVLLLAGLTYTHAIGAPAPISSLRSLTQVEFRLASTWRQQCVGSIVTNYHVLTAASCLQNSSSNRRIRVGSAIKAFGGVVREVAIIVNHNEADIGIMRAASSWNLGGPEINNVVLVPENYFLPPQVGLTFAGWGITAQGGLVPDQYLHQAILESKAVQNCVSAYPGQIDAGMVCVGLPGRNGRDFDPSDAGAPILYEGYLYGVSAFGSSNANNDKPIVAQAIAVYGPWVRYAASIY